MEKLCRISSNDAVFPRKITPGIIKACFRDKDFSADVYQDTSGRLFITASLEAGEFMFEPLTDAPHFAKVFYKPYLPYLKNPNIVNKGYGFGKNFSDLKEKIIRTMPIDNQFYIAMYAGEWCYEMVKSENGGIVICNGGAFKKKEIPKGEKAPLYYQMLKEEYLPLEKRTEGHDTRLVRLNSLYCKPGNLFY